MHQTVAGNVPKRRRSSRSIRHDSEHETRRNRVSAGRFASMKIRFLQIYILVATVASLGATVQTENFEVTASSAEVAQSVADSAEECRRQLAIDWLGAELPVWEPRCLLKVTVRDDSSNGVTSYRFDRGRAGAWEVEVTGTLERIIDSVLPHELSHTILASRFSRPLPRWADEGAAMLAETESERTRQRLLTRELVNSKNRTPLRQLLRMKEYPQDRAVMLSLYSVGFSLADFLVQSGGKERYLQFLDRAGIVGWDPALDENYGFIDVESFELNWLKWVNAGSPPLKPSRKGKWVNSRSVESPLDQATKPLATRDHRTSV